ncbi:MAG: hypothetical protein EXS43_14325 [Opitutus sp.]|nr:hypothetical protein [Opitutus sp.]
MPSARAIAALAERKLPHPPLLVTTKLTDNIVKLCRERSIHCLDVNGRTWISREGVFIDRAGRSESYKPAQLPPDAFSTKSVRLVRALLSGKDRSWTQAELGTATQLSPGLVSRLLRHLRDDGFVERENRSVRIARHSELLEAWAAKDRWANRVTLRQYSILTLNFDQVADQVLKLTPNTRVAFTQWFAANQRFPYTPAPVLSAYVSAFPDDSFLKELQARPVTDGGRLWLAVPNDPGVFQQVRLVRNWPLVADPQIYLDLLSIGLRGPDQAKALRDWDGFCR